MKIMLLVFLLLSVVCSGSAFETDVYQIVRENSKPAVYSVDGVRVSEFYDSLEPARDGVFIISAGGEFGLLNADGTEILEPAYDWIYPQDDCFVILKNHLWGLCDADGTVLIEPTYQELYYQNGTVSVGRYGPGGGAGVVERNGSILVPLVYERAAPFENGWAWVMTKGDYLVNFVNRNGEVFLDVPADSGYFVGNRWIRYRYGDEEFLISLDKNMIHKIRETQLTCLNSGDLFVSCNYQHWFEEDRAGKTQQIYHADTDTYSSLGDVMVDESGFHEGLIRAQNGEGKWGYLDEAFQTAIPFMFDEIRYFSEGRAWVKIGDVHYLIDRNGNLYGSFAGLEKACRFSEGIAAIRAESGWGFVDAMGRVMLEPSLQSREDELVFQNGYCDLLNSEPLAGCYIDHTFQIAAQWDVTELYEKIGIDMD